MFKFTRIIVSGLVIFGASTAQADRTWVYTYNALGQVETANGPRTDVSDITHYAYDANNGNLLSVTNPQGHIIQTPEYDAQGRPLTLIDQNGLRTELAYNLKGQITSYTVKASTGDILSSFIYDKAGQRIQATLPNGSSMNYDYDNAHRLERIRNGDGEKTEFTYDAAGNITATKIYDHLGALTRQQQQVYDDLSRLKKSVGGTDQQTTQYDHDGVGNTTGITDPKQNPATQQQFDALNRRTKITDAEGGITQIEYNSKDQITKVIDPRGVVTEYQYNGLGDQTVLVSADTGTTTFTHDEAGNVLTKTDSRNVLTQYSYDVLGRLVTVSYPASPQDNIQYGYDDTTDGNQGIGRLTSISDQGGTTTYKYNELGLVTEKTHVITGKSYTTVYHYDAHGELESISYPTGRIVHYSYDTQGRLNGLDTQQDGNAPIETLVSDIRYLPFGPVSAFTYGNGFQQSYLHDLDYRLTQITGSVKNWVYSHDLNSNIEQIIDLDATNNTQAYSYDTLNRLVSVVGPHGTIAYAYDGAGNRASKTDSVVLETIGYQYDITSNQLDTVDSNSITRDPSGNRTSDQNGNRTYHYDSAGRLIEIREAGISVVSYAYNHLNQRVSKTLADGSVVHYHHDDSGRLWSETDGQGNALRDYVWMGDIPVAMVDYTGVTERVTYLHADHLNTPRYATDETGTLVWQWSSDAFGNGAPNEDPDGDGTAITLNLRFPGQYYDAESGLHYNCNRYYDPEIGRYITSDPIGLDGGLNTFGYVGGNPVNWIDSNGLLRTYMDKHPEQRTDEVRRKGYQICSQGFGDISFIMGATSLSTLKNNPGLSGMMGVGGFAFSAISFMCSKSIPTPDNDNDNDCKPDFGTTDNADSDDDNDGIPDFQDPNPKIPEVVCKSSPYLCDYQ